MSVPSQYCSVAELQAAPLGISLKNMPQLKMLGVGAPTGQQVYAAAQQLIRSASAAADNYCQMVLGATKKVETLLTEEGTAWIDREGILWVRVSDFPILYVESIQYASPSMSPKEWNVVNPLDSLIFMGQSMIGAPAWLSQRGWPRILAQVTYVNGFANAFMTAASSPGDFSVQVNDVTGFMTGQVVTIYDLGNTESATVSTAYAAPLVKLNGAPTPGIVGFDAPLLYAHTPIDPVAATGTTQPYGIRVSSAPDDLAWAIFLICKSFLQEQGSASLVMGSTAGIRGRTEIRITTDDIPLEAKGLLNNYKSVF